jgi:hypothetical protein
MLYRTCIIVVFLGLTSILATGTPDLAIGIDTKTDRPNALSPVVTC